MKKINYLFLTLLCLLCGTTPMAAQSFEDGGIYYNVTDATNKTVEVTSNENKEVFYTGDIVIPATASDGSNTYAVTSIGLSAFAFCESLTSITIPSSVESIGYYAFRYCKSLTNITIPSSVKSIGDGAFYGCESLTSVAFLGEVTSIGYVIFAYCDLLKTIYVPDYYTYYYQNDYLAKYADQIVGSTFTFTKDGITYKITNPGEVEVTYDETASYTGDIVIPATVPHENNTYAVTSIGYGVFHYCTGLTSVTIPNSVKSIGDGAFCGCESLTSITISNSVKSIGDGAFYGCESLKSITIPNSVTSIGNEAFYYCTGLTSVTIPEGVKNIGVDAFNNCTSLTNITIPNSVESIGDYAFYYCESLTNITIPNSVKSIGYKAFNYCKSLKSITIPNSVTSIGDDAFSNCIDLTSITIPSSVKNIGHYAFNDCESLTNITIPNSVENIGHYAFNGCTSLTTVAILGGATSIGNEAFGYCTALETIYVPYASAEAYKANANLAEHSDKISVSVELKAATIGGAYASVYLPFPATLVEGDAKAYVGASLEEGTLTLARATEIAANEGFILYADAATTATLRVGATEAAATSIIEGTSTEITLTDDNRADYLVFGISNGEIGFFKPAASIGSIPANRAFLPNTGGVSAVRMQFDFGTTGIEVIENGEWRMDNGSVYDLSGRRVTSPAKGSLYIRNGQKFIWK